MTTKTAFLALGTLALVACNTEEPVDSNAADLATEQAPPPGAGGLTLDVAGVMENGNQMTFTVTGAQPGESVFLIWGRGPSPGALCPGPLGGLCLDVDRPNLLGIRQNPLTADAAGTATLTVNAPPASILPNGFEAWFQAATTRQGTQATSNVIPKWNPADTGLLSVDIYDFVDVVPGVSYTGVREEIYYAYDGTIAGFPTFDGWDPVAERDLCYIQADASGTGLGALPPCPSCQFAFEVTYSNFSDVSISGDCNYFFGLDPSTIPPATDAWGFQYQYNIPGYGYADVLMFYYATGGYWSWATNNVYYNGGQFAWGLVELGLYGYP
jgi:hypothetical protein